MTTKEEWDALPKKDKLRWSVLALLLWPVMRLLFKFAERKWPWL